MDWNKVWFSGAAAGSLSLLVNMGFTAFGLSLVADAPLVSSILRGQWMLGSAVQAFAFAFAFAYMFSLLAQRLPWAGVMKGVNLSMLAWLVWGFPSLLSVFFAQASLAVAVMSFAGVVNAFAAGLVTGLVFEGRWK